MAKSNGYFEGRRPPIRPEEITEKNILGYLKELADRLGKDTLTWRDVNVDGYVNVGTIVRNFGIWSDVLEKAGLRPPKRTYKRNPKQMIDSLASLCEKLGRLPSKTEIRENTGYPASVYESEFGSFDLALERAGYPIASLVARPHTRGARKPRRKFGSPIDFRGLRHSPINELGVVFLFGVIAKDLGFEVESVQAGYPDCTAKKKRRDGSFEEARIEFEFKSSSFKKHKHDPEGCDYIVCWEHDWKDCPSHLVVIELSEEIKKF